MPTQNRAGTDAEIAVVEGLMSTIGSSAVSTCREATPRSADAAQTATEVSCSTRIAALLEHIFQRAQKPAIANRRTVETVEQREIRSSKSTAQHADGDADARTMLMKNSQCHDIRSVMKPPTVGYVGAR